MLDALREEDVVVVVTRLDRLARSTKDLLDIAEQLNAIGAGLRSQAEPWADTTSPRWAHDPDRVRRHRRVRVLTHPSAHQFGAGGGQEAWRPVSGGRPSSQPTRSPLDGGLLKRASPSAMQPLS